MCFVVVAVLFLLIGSWLESATMAGMDKKLIAFFLKNQGLQRKVWQLCAHMMLSHAKACSTVTAISKKATVCNSESGSCHQGMLPSTNSLQLRIWELPPRNATEQPTVSVSESGSRHQEVLRKQPTVSHS